MPAPRGQCACDALISTGTAVLRFVPESWSWRHVTVSHGRQLRALPCTSCQGLSAHADDQAPVRAMFHTEQTGEPFHRCCCPSWCCAKARGLAHGGKQNSKAEITECWHAHCLDRGLSAPVFSHLCSRNRNWERSRAQSDPKDIFRCRAHLRGTWAYLAK